METDLVQSEISTELDKQLKSQTVDALNWEDLTDKVTETGSSFEDFLAQTQSLIAESNDELWRMQWDATVNLRVMNKFHYTAFAPQVCALGEFIRGQAENLRSNNSRNALQLFEELFAQNKEAHSNTDGRKEGEDWTKFVANVLPTILVKCYADKQFIAKIAQRGVLACAETCPVIETTHILSKSCPSKNLKLAEFSVQAIS